MKRDLILARAHRVRGGLELDFVPSNVRQVLKLGPWDTFTEREDPELAAYRLRALGKVLEELATLPGVSWQVRPDGSFIFETRDPQVAEDYGFSPEYEPHEVVKLFAGSRAQYLRPLKKGGKPRSE